jgi:two-component system, NtrC family, response regulator HydG
MSRILVVDDKEMMRDSVSTTLARKGHTVVTAPGAQIALSKLADKPCDAVITDLQMPEMTGVDLLAEIRRIDEQIPVILMTAYGTIETAVSAMKRGAWDYITKPFSGDALIITVEKAIEHARLAKENAILRAAAAPVGCSSAAPAMHEMIGSSPVMQHLRERLAMIADSHGTVLISGESGSGKEVAARWIHEHSPRADQPFLAINCAALSTSLLESELFGHEKGAFTGADKLRKGRFELADGGTLLLDEISEIAPEIQAKLLRVLQERAFERVGSSQSRSADVRIIATTNRDLPAEAARGRFRQDLYFRLNVLPLSMPPLRERVADVAALASHFLASVAQREGKPAKTLEPEALRLLQGYAWPGNVRELQNICERAAVLTNDDVIHASMIAPWLGGALAPIAVPAYMNGMDGGGGASTPTSNGVHRHVDTPRPASMIEVMGDVARQIMDARAIVCDGQVTLEDIEREIIVATLGYHHGHRQKSATALGIGVRTLGLKLKKWKEEKLVSETL